MSAEPQIPEAAVEAAVAYLRERFPVRSFEPPVRSFEPPERTARDVLAAALPHLAMAGSGPFDSGARVQSTQARDKGAWGTVTGPPSEHPKLGWVVPVDWDDLSGEPRIAPVSILTFHAPTQSAGEDS